MSLEEHDVMQWASESDVGLVRTNNEDSCLVTAFDKHDRLLTLMLVCDGMGGTEGGEIASQIACDVIASHLQIVPCPVEPEALYKQLLEAFKVANHLVYTTARRTPRLSGMGTTVTAVLAWEKWALVAQIGDSRAYLLRDGNLVQLTRDQTLVRQMIELGQLTPESAKDFVGSHVILQALGSQDEVLVDCGLIELQPNDRWLVCSDGLHNDVTEEQMLNILQENQDPHQACQALIRIANESGGYDNTSCIVADVVDPTLPVLHQIPVLKPVLSMLNNVQGGDVDDEPTLSEQNLQVTSEQEHVSVVEGLVPMVSWRKTWMEVGLFGAFLLMVVHLLWRWR
jgi:PPM family protein phosphatase